MTAVRMVMLEDVLEGLSMPEKELSPKYLYDTRGSELFEEITLLDEYYLTRTEHALLRRWMPEWVSELGPASLVELGAGSARKSRVILDAMERPGTGILYVPVDVSAEFLHDTAARLREEYDGLQVEPAVADITAPIELPVELPEPAWFALLGSTIGNFTPETALKLVARISKRLRPGDRFLMGADRRPGPHKPKERIELAYDDPDGVSAAFALNVLRVLNRELGADFRGDAFRYGARYDEDGGRIEMYLESTENQTVRFDGGAEVAIAAGERIRTEYSHKFDRARVDELFAAASLEVDRWAEDELGYFALVLGRRVG